MLEAAEPAPWGVVALVVAGQLFAASLMFVMARLGARGRLKRNPFFGIRTKRSLADDESWDTVHRVAAPWVFLAGVPEFLGAVALPFTPRDSGTAFLVVVLLSAALMILFLIIGTVLGTGAAGRAR